MDPRKYLLTVGSSAHTRQTVDDDDATLPQKPKLLHSTYINASQGHYSHRTHTLRASNHASSRHSRSSRGYVDRRLVVSLRIGPPGRTVRISLCCAGACNGGVSWKVDRTPRRPCWM